MVCDYWGRSFGSGLNHKEMEQMRKENLLGGLHIHRHELMLIILADNLFLIYFDLVILLFHGWNLSFVLFNTRL